MLRLKRWVAQRAVLLVGNGDSTTRLQPANAAVQAALQGLDFEVTKLGTMLRLWWLASCVERCAYGARKMREFQEVANALRN